MNQSSEPAVIGVFDSGVGGLSVLRAIRAQLPCQPVIYLADQAHVPYGARTQAEVCQYAEGITRFLLARGAKVIVIACNAASGAALYHLRSVFPQVPFVGMEPAVKPAASSTHTGVIGVLATPVTFQGELYNSVVSRFARDVMVLQDACPGLVAQIEACQLDAPLTRQILEQALHPMLEKHLDTIVMGCTHYPFVIPLIQDIVGPGVQVIDPAPAVARQTRRLLESHHLLSSCEIPALASFFSTGDSSHLSEMLPRLLGEEHVVQYIPWESGKLQ
jgi:glutamate racemase